VLTFVKASSDLLASQHRSVIVLGWHGNMEVSSRQKVMKSLLVRTGRYLYKVYNYHDRWACRYKQSGILYRLDWCWMGLVLVREWDFVLTFVFYLTIILVFCWTINFVFSWTTTFVFCWTITFVFCWTITFVFCWAITFVFYWTITFVFCWTTTFIFGGTMSSVGYYPVWTYFTWLGYWVVQLWHP
jgi:hypothetical protein